MSGLLGAFERMTPQEAARVLGLADEEHEYRFRKDDVNAAFRALASKVHPDRGGEAWQMRALLEARDVLLQRSEKPAARSRKAGLETAEVIEMRAFARRASTKKTTVDLVDLADAWLALPRIRKWGLTLDHPRAGKLARAEANRSKRAERCAGVITPPRDGRQGVTDSESDDTGTGGTWTWMPVDESQLAERFREKAAAKGKKWAMDLINPSAPTPPLETLIEKEDAASRVARGLPADPAEARDAERESLKKAALGMRAALKPRDREVLDLYVGQGMTAKQVADCIGKTDKAVYASIARMKTPMREERERKEWVDEHCSIEKLACGVASAPVILQKDQQLGWDLGGAI